MKQITNKKIIVAILLILSLLLTAACGNKENTDQTKAADESAENAAEANTDTSEAEEPGSESKADSNTDSQPALADGVLDIGTNAAFPPYEYYEGEQIVGIDADIAAEIGKKLGYEIKFHDMEFANIIASIESGKVDIGIAGMTVTEKRLQSVNFSDSYATGIQAVIVTKDSEIKSIDDLEGKKIGTQFGTTGDSYAQEDYGIENVQSFDKGADAVIALLAGNIDCVIIDKEPAKSFIKSDDSLQLLDTDYAVEDYAIAVPKDNEALLAEINQAIASLKEDGTIKKIIDTYIKAE